MQCVQYRGVFDVPKVEYSVCIVNGLRFHTKDLDNRRVTQNSGVSTEEDHDRQIHDFYGYVCKI